MNCPTCKKPTSKDSKFCDNCGLALPAKNNLSSTVVCPKCHSEIDDGNKYCPTCGQELYKKPKLIFKKIKLIPWFLFKKLKSGLSYLTSLKPLFKKKFIIIAIIVVVVLITGFILIINGTFKNISGGVKYTLNPAQKSTSIESVVKIVTEEGEASGLLFTKEGHILTNAHVVTSSLGKSLGDIKVCYTTKGTQEPKCDYEAKIIDVDNYIDLAVIKVDRKITEVKPYLLVVKEDNEENMFDVLDMGSKINIIGYPGVGGSTITMTSGIISGYKNEEYLFRDGRLERVPTYAKTDTQINPGNSGGAVFDGKNRYIGMPRYIAPNPDAGGGKISYIIFWNKIDGYLKDLIYKGVLTLDKNQYIEKKTKKNEKDFWDGLKALTREDYGLAKTKLESYSKVSPEGSGGWNYLCETYEQLEEYDNLERCAERLRSLGNKAIAMSWFYSARARRLKEPSDKEAAYEFADKALAVLSESLIFLNEKTVNSILMGKISEANELNNKSLGIDELQPVSWFLAGWIAEESNEPEGALVYYEYAFELFPTAGTADYLAEIYYDRYYNSEEPIDTDIVSALEYSLAGLILESKDPKNLNRIFTIIMSYFGDFDISSSIGETLSDIKNTLLNIGLNRKLIEPIENVNDGDLKEYLKNEGIEEPTQEQIKGYGSYIKILASWLYTLIGEKNMCKNFSYDGKFENLVSLFEAVGFTKEEATGKLFLFAAMDCFCKLNDYSFSVVNQCTTDEANALCGQGKIYSKGKCITSDTACKAEYGSYSYATKDGQCACGAGYGWNSTGTACVLICSANSYYLNGQCLCNAGYSLYNGKCITQEESCLLSGYAMYYGKCISREEFCHNYYGPHSYYSSFNVSVYCGCDWGYKWNNDTTYCIPN